MSHPPSSQYGRGLVKRAIGKAMKKAMKMIMAGILNLLILLCYPSSMPLTRKIDRDIPTIRPPICPNESTVPPGCKRPFKRANPTIMPKKTRYWYL